MPLLLLEEEGVLPTWLLLCILAAHGVQKSLYHTTYSTHTFLLHAATAAAAATFRDHGVDDYATPSTCAEASTRVARAPPPRHAADAGGRAEHAAMDL
jgi:hypothetical protein